MKNYKLNIGINWINIFNHFDNNKYFILQYNNNKKSFRKKSIVHYEQYHLLREFLKNIPHYIDEKLRK